MKLKLILMFVGLSLSNVYAGEIGEIIELFNSEAELGPSQLGTSIPKGVSSIDITGGQEKEKSFRKEMKNRLDQHLVNFAYDLSFEFAVQRKGNGAFVHNILFTPTRLNLAAGHEYRVTGRITKVRNVGTAKHPVMEVSVEIIHKFKRPIPYPMVVSTDTFKIHGFTGFTTAVIDPLSGPPTVVRF